jgi:DNA repair exonuclease SbcCD ATPase subunit
LEELQRTTAALQSAHELELQALRERLEPQLAELEQRLSSRDTELQESREAAEFSLLQLHQVQEELEDYFLADGEKQRQLQARGQELEELRLTKAAQESAHELELQALRERLEPQLAELEQRLSSRDIELQELREAAELSLVQLHQVQEELEDYFLADGEKQRQLQARGQELEELRLTKAAQESAHELELQALRERLEPQLADLEQRLSSRDTELQEAREAAELSLLQLHQLQEELEHYFLKARASEQLAQAQFEQLQRAQGLMLRLQPDVLPTAPYSPSLAVQVLPEVAAAMSTPTLQTEALLSTYAATLQRASALLERARRL